MTIDDYHAKIEYDSDLDMFRGEILDLNGGADFYGRTLDELRIEFRNSLKVFLDVCQENNISPYRNNTEKLNISVPCELHKSLTNIAAIKGRTINSLAQEALEKYIHQAIEL